MNQKFIAKMLQAKKLEKEAVCSLLPSSIEQHMTVIENEIKRMLFDLAKEGMEKGVSNFYQAANNAENGEGNQIKPTSKNASCSSKVKKVTIE